MGKRKEMKVLTVAALVVRNANEAFVAPVEKSGRVCVWRAPGVRRLVPCCNFGSNLTSLALKMFSHFLAL
jgi:hypothetical protein